MLEVLPSFISVTCFGVVTLIKKEILDNSEPSLCLTVCIIFIISTVPVGRVLAPAVPHRFDCRCIYTSGGSKRPPYGWGGINEMANVGADALGGPATPIELLMSTDTMGVEGAAPYVVMNNKNPVSNVTHGIRSILVHYKSPVSAAHRLCPAGRSYLPFPPARRGERWDSDIPSACRIPCLRNCRLRIRASLYPLCG